MITVAIPTIAGREHYLESSLRTCVTQDADFEILVSDNPGGGAREVVAAFGDPRIRYVTPPRYLPMSAHWDFVLSEVHGEMVSIIGDDDGLMPGCIRRVGQIVEQIGLIPIHHSFANYFWSDCPDPCRRNKTFFFHTVGQTDQVVSSRHYLNEVARARARYLDGPMAYHNFLPTSLLKSLTKSGRFFRRAAPDVYSAIAIAANTDSFFSSGELLTLSGQGKHSTGAAVQSGASSNFTSEWDAHYRSRFNSRTVQLALLDSLVEVAEHFELPDLGSKIELAAHFAAAWIETRAMPAALKAHERRVILAGITKGAFFRELASALVERLRVRKRIFQTKESTFKRGQSINMPVGTQGVFEASIALSDMLKRPT